MKKILIADDEEVLRMLIVDTLEGDHHQLDEAEDGIEALSLIKKEQYDLLILDYMMPEKSGIEVLMETRKLAIPQPKVLMLTAKSQQKDQDEMYKEGANYFLAKPFSPIELLSLVEEMLSD
ncbi:response regulator transcription factor [Alkalihalophilus pseudofirmus]|uniref:Response regulator transcription factor n=1 Tax=Alkalihalophilus pseudofirmus TaxID=79885 RepID=A0AAJ2NML9_ALKPS|nr:response regulator transcription factor [Alkalihalophilus pseudofirmus]MDV2884150.1 response regulator transcription factor [Alkalihalophilus pseudofirmus]